MRTCALLLSVSLFIAIIIQAMGAERDKAREKPEAEAVYTIADAPIIPQTHRIGINLGRSTSYGTSQLDNNILKNPGLEGQIDRHLVIVSQADTYSFSDEAGWGYPNFEWNEAEFQIRTGKSAGKRGSIKRSLNSGDNGFPQYFSNSPLPPIESNDIIILTKIRRPDPIDLWQSRPTQTAAVDPAASRPQSAGSQSFRLTPTTTSTAELSYTLDALADRAGKGIKIAGKWRFRVWAKGEKPSGQLTVIFKRMNSAQPFFKTTLELTTEWQEYVVDFFSTDPGPPGALKLSITAFHPLNSVWIDDLYLGRLDQENVPFRKEIVHVLKELAPSFIREFPSLGDTWENRIAVPHERKTWMRRLTGGKAEAVYSYSLPEFLSLCREVGANPWIIVPPTLSNYESQEMGRYLEKHASAFSEVILEFGYENWNWLYRQTAVPYEKQHGILANRIFDLIARAAGKKVNLTKFVNGQYTVPWESLQFLDGAASADGLAVAPYFFHSLDRGTPDKQALASLFQPDFSALYKTASEVYARDKRLAIYEVNLSTTQGSARRYERNRVVGSAAAGAALGKHLIELLMLGADPVMVYNLAQYDTPAWEVEEFVNLFGIVRDFGPPMRFRPTGLVVKLLNEVIQGALYRVELTGEGEDKAAEDNRKMTLAAFRGSGAWSLAAVSESGRPRTIQVRFPEDGMALPKRLKELHSSSPFDNNEEGEGVVVKEREVKADGQAITFTVPAYGFAVLGG